jgi:hypothetical protein
MTTYDPSPVDNLRILDVLVYYDRPLLYTCRNGESGQAFLVLFADESETDETWLYAPLSDARMTAILAGDVTLKEAFTKAEGGAVYAERVQSNDGARLSLEAMDAATLPDDMLPEPQCRLGGE